MPATVPGCVHTDLLAAGLIPDPYLDENERLLEWIGRTAWRYSTTFRAAAARRASASTWSSTGSTPSPRSTLNGAVLGATANMHRSYRFDVRDAPASTGDNELTVDFAAQTDAEPSRRAWSSAPRPARQPLTRTTPSARWPATSAGTGGPTLVTAGIWRPVTPAAVDHGTAGRGAAARDRATAATARVEVHVDVERAAGRAAGAGRGRPSRVRTAEVEVGAGRHGACCGSSVPDVGAVVAARLRRAAALPASSVRCWPTTTELDDVAAPGRLPHRDAGHRRPTRRHAVHLRRQRHARSSSRGANWIPDDCFPTRIDRDPLRRAASRSATEAGMNLLRVWGGGIYESEDFYEICDETG